MRTWLNAICLVISGMSISACLSETEREEATNPEEPITWPSGDWEYRAIPERQYRPVADANAPTIGELEDRGLVNVVYDGEMYACGPACDAVYVYAYFYGPEKRQFTCYRKAGEGLKSCLPQIAEFAEYVCPEPRKPLKLNEWPCRRLSLGD